MKKIFAAMFAALMICMMTACGNSSAEKNSADEKNPPAEKNPAAAEQSAAEKSANEILVVYFSCAGHTKKAALEVAEILHADTFEIVPAEPYTPEDLNYNVKNCRANVEQENPAARPEIAGKIENFAQYKTVVVAFPIWWGAEPRIIDTFVESYDFAGKKIIPVCTSGGSDIQAAEKNLREMCKGASVLEGKRLGIISTDEVKAWLDSLKL